MREGGDIDFPVQVFNRHAAPKKIDIKNTTVKPKFGLLSNIIHYAVCRIDVAGRM